MYAIELHTAWHQTVRGALAPASCSGPAMAEALSSATAAAMAMAMAQGSSGTAVAQGSGPALVISQGSTVVLPSVEVMPSGPAETIDLTRSESMGSMTLLLPPKIASMAQPMHSSLPPEPLQTSASPPSSLPVPLKQVTAVPKVQRTPATPLNSQDTVATHIMLIKQALLPPPTPLPPLPPPPPPPLL